MLLYFLRYCVCNDTRCTCNITVWRFCVTIVAVETRHYLLCTVGLHMSAVNILINIERLATETQQFVFVLRISYLRQECHN